ncbi:alpha/beta hydrolase [Paraglaciecola sp. 2405UD69-4]|uniref:alpha/beta hydrolase n=1 Tax=Paraglaciecola sp. 2405UD69-4 TaxID=3391836 RepID=UPI0039C97CB9
MLVRLLSSIFIFSFLLTACSEPEKHSTATSNVQVLPFKFAITGLDKQRTVRLYLPPSYDTSEKSYPVVYMHDGQNLFDDLTADKGEWGVDESLNALAASEQFEVIVVAIDHGDEERMNELSPWENKRFGVAQGKEYMDFIVEVVKVYVDNNFRTKPERLYTAIMGSDMGGLMSHYALHAYPEVFSKAGIFSPAYWYSQDVFAFTRFSKAKLDSRLFILYSDNEGDGMIADNDKMYRQLKSQGHPRDNMKFKRISNNEKAEQLWKNNFSEAVTWLFQKQPAF